MDPIAKRDRDYRALWRALIYIQDNLDADLSLKNLAAIAHYSPYHFHRLFKEFTGETVKAYIRRLRLDASAFALKVGDKPVTDLALQSGYFTHESFTRAFRTRFGISPSEYRARRSLPERCSDEHIRSIDTVYFIGRTCAYVRYDGPYEATPAPDHNDSPWMRLMVKMGLRNADPDDCEWFGISRDDPEITDSPLIRYDACVGLPVGYSTESSIPTIRLETDTMIRAIYHGPFAELTEAYHYILRVWAAEHDMQLGIARPPFEKFVFQEWKWIATELYFPIDLK